MTFVLLGASVFFLICSPDFARAALSFPCPAAILAFFMPRKRPSAKPHGRASRPEIAVIGAGAFGGWTALHLLRLGARVTLIDAFGAGDLRAASSGETRVIRASYGHKPIYAEWTARALKLWKQFERESRMQLFVPSGVLWLYADEDDYARSSLATLKRLRIPFERLDRRAIERRFPQFSADGVSFAWFEPQAGFLLARVATQAVAAAVAREGGRVITGAVEPPQSQSGRLRSIHVAQAFSLCTDDAKQTAQAESLCHETIEAEQFVFACGAWLPQLFPNLLTRRILVTRQEVFFFGPPPGDARFTAPHMPVWLDPARAFYGIPAALGRGLKVADDASGPPFDPSTSERAVSADGLRAARAYLAGRIPAMAGAPLVESRVCQYARTPDAHLVIDRHPSNENVWLIGGGSGHGFKLGPALGEFVARHVLASHHELAASGRSTMPQPILAQMRLGACEWPAGTERPGTRSL
ncbi:MAG: FAD-dependent oxidoreductase [Candidatus Acidiferrales bacterium]